MSSGGCWSGLLGANIQGSIAPALFADSFAPAGIGRLLSSAGNADRLPGRSLPQLFDAIKTAGFAGANVTYPFKQEIMPLLDRNRPRSGADRCHQHRRDRAGWPHHRYNLIAAAGGTAFAGNLWRRRGTRKTVVQVGAGCAGAPSLRADGPRRRRSGPS